MFTKILQVLEVSAENEQIATKLVVANPLAEEDKPDSVVDVEALLKPLLDQRDYVKVDAMTLFKAILSHMLECRLLLPPILNLNLKYFVYDTNSGKMKLILSDTLFEKPSECNNLSITELKCKSPEELFTNNRSLTTPFWVLGCLLYEASFGYGPFQTNFKPAVMKQFIKKYPVVFDEKSEKTTSDLQDILEGLLTKDPNQRLGSDLFEKEILEHAYF